MSKRYSPTYTRRSVLGGGATLAFSSFIPTLGHTSGSGDPRLITIILRGALDGLAAVAPISDPEWARSERATSLLAHGPKAILPLDGFYGLNGNLTHFHSLYQKGQALIVHAVATPYRGLSHFDGQDVLESGLAGPGNISSGWLNRAIETLKPAQNVEVKGLAVGPIVPVIMRGNASVLTWGSNDVDDISPDTLARLMALYSERDQALGATLDDMIASRYYTTEGEMNPLDSAYSGFKRKFVRAAEGAGTIMARDDGPRVATLSFDGWDTHANQSPIAGKLGSLLSGLDAVLKTLETVMQPVWRDTAILVVTEFGRTVAENGTDGTDHGSGTTALLAGGAVQGGKVYSDWPGLSKNSLFEGRGLMPTTDLRSIAKDVLHSHLGVGKDNLEHNVFPDSGSAPIKYNLIR